MNLVQIQERLKDLPMQAIMSYANGMNPQVPPYLALGEMNRRKQMEQQAAQPPKATVKENLEQQMGLAQLQNMRQAPMMGQPPMQPQAPQAPEVMPQPEAEMAMAAGGVAHLPVDMEFASGGIIAFANPEGDQLVKDEDKLDSGVAKKILKRIKQREGTEPLDPIETPAEVDNTIPGFVAGNRFAEEMDKANRRPPVLTPQQMEPKVRTDLSDQIPGQRFTAPASTGSMPGEVERNVTNTLNALPGASVTKAFQGGPRGLMALMAALPSFLRTSSGSKEAVPMADADQNLGSAIMAESSPRPAAAPAAAKVPVAAPISRPTSQMTPSQMEAAYQSGIVNVAKPPPSDQPRPSAQQGGPRPVAPAPVVEKSEAQKFQEKLLSGTGLAALPEAYVPPKQAPIGEDYMKFMDAREQKRREDALKFEDVQKARDRRDFFNSLIEGAEASRGQRGIGALVGGTGKSLGRYATEAEDRRSAFQKAQQELADNDAKTRFEIANLRRAEERGDSKTIYESRVKLSELNNQRTQIQSTAANQIAGNESAERVARANNLTQLEVARINQATSMKPGETERLMQQYAEIKRTKGEAAAEDFMRTIERVKTGSRGETAQQKLNVQRQALAEKLPTYQMALNSYINSTDPKKKSDALVKVREIEAMHGIKSEEPSSGIDLSQWGTPKVK
jgi:hypothetical protein